MSVRSPIRGDPTAMVAQLRRLAADDPGAALDELARLDPAGAGDPRFIRLRAAALRKLGRDDEAEGAEAEAIALSTRGPLHRQAARAMAEGDTARAEALLESLLAEDDGDVVALVMRGVIASGARQGVAADHFFAKAVALAPADAPARLAFARHLQASYRSALALDQLDRLRDETAQTAPALWLRAQVLKSLGRLDEEVALLERLRGTSDGDKALLALGHAYRSLGRTDEAVAAYRGLLARSPDEGAAWWSLANLKTVRFTDADIAAMERAIKRSGHSRANVAQLHFALGKAEEDRKRPAAAYDHYAAGNRLMAGASAYRPQAISRWVDQASALFAADFYAERSGSGSPARDPIFIIGMQRSGSTLVEQILATHSAIEGTAELNDLPNIVRAIEADAARAGVGHGDYLRGLAGEALTALGDSYIAATRVHRREDKSRFTDKLPTNWINLPILRAILPNAKIVDVRRHPLDCCLSNWKQLYGTGLEHSYSMEWMGLYYADYVRLMRHMDAVQPGAVHRVVYERLVEDPEGEAKALFDYLGLPFEPAVLDFHRTNRAVRTISAGQVRQPINRKGVGQWRSFEPWLDPMKAALGDVLETWEQ